MRHLREPANGLIHLAGALLAVVALALLLRLAVGAGTARHVVAYAVFGLSLVALYTASALHHLLRLPPAATTACCGWTARWSSR